MESTDLVGATTVAEGRTSWTQQGSASLVQTLASTFYRYKVVMATDKTIWSWPSKLVA